MNIRKIQNAYTKVFLLENTEEQDGGDDKDDKDGEDELYNQSPGVVITPDEQELLDKLESKIAVGKVKLYQAAPELSRILSQLNINIVNSNSKHVPTMAVDDYGNIYINPSFSNTLTDEEFFGVFAHEALHIANGTFLRKGNRDHETWNQATDAIMNWGLMRDGFELPKGAILPDVDSGKLDLGLLGSISILDSRGYPLAAEDIYNKIIEAKKAVKFTLIQLPKGVTIADYQETLDVQNKKIDPNYTGFKTLKEHTDTGGIWATIAEYPNGIKKVMPVTPQDGDGEGEGPDGGGGGDLIKGDGKGKGNGKGKGDGEGEGDGDGKGKGKGKGASAGGYSNNKGGGRSSNSTTPTQAEKEDIIRRYMKDLGKHMVDRHLTKEEAKKVNKNLDETITPERMKELEKARQDDIKRGEVESKRQSSISRSSGTGSGGATRKVISANIPVVVDWKGVIKRYLKQATRGFTTWMRPNNRGLAGGYLSPSTMPATNKLEAVFAVDTSGSIGAKELQTAFTYIKQIAKEAHEINVRICLWHHNAYFISKPVIEKGALETTLSRMTAQSGGTDISSIDPFLKTNKINPYVVIYITDGYVESNPVFGRYQKLFVIVNNESKSPDVQEMLKDIFAKHGKIVITPSLTD